MENGVKTIDEQLRALPIKGRENDGAYERLVRGIQDGEVKVVTLEKTFVPANEISRYVIVEHQVGDPSSKSNIHTHIEKSTHFLFEEAQRIFRERANSYQSYAPFVTVGELLLVGKFGEGPLEYNKDGELLKTSGITLDYALTLPGRSYSLTAGRDPFHPVTIQEKLFARYDFKTQNVQLLDAGLNEVSLNDFWQRKEGPSVNGKKIEPKDVEEIELLPKLSFGQSNGIKR